MNRTKARRPLTIIFACLFTTATLSLAQQSGTMDRIREFLAQGAISLDVRPRYEHVEQTGVDDAHALTARTRLGFTTPSLRGFTGMFEVENIASPFPNGYNQSQINPGGSDKAIVTDPIGTEINQAWIGYTLGRTALKLGRQPLRLGNARFIGDHGWRQHMQTIDGFVVENSSVKDLALTYAYLWRVNRVFGDRHPQGVYESNSHVIHAAYAGLPGGTLSGYVYLLEFKDTVVGNSCATYGLSYEGARSWGRFRLGYRAEYALQTDYGNSPLFYSADYLTGEITAAFGRYSAGGGYELLSADNNFAVRTPLGSLHDFNGWADAFLITPLLGLRDAWWRVGVDLPWRFGLVAYQHQFDTDSGIRLGKELDVQVSYPINDSLSALVKYAAFKRVSTTVPDVTKLWLQVEMSF